MNKKRIKRALKKTWHFIWEDNSIWSWIVNIILAFVLIKFIVYPGLGLILGTDFPIVAVVSESMEHNANFNDWWSKSSTWYLDNNITKEDFMQFPQKKGFNKGDIMVLIGKKPSEVQIGSIIVFKSSRPDPIIHRVVKKWKENNVYFFQTKGDNYKTNPTSIKNSGLDETRINQNQLVGKAVLKIPLLGYIKIWFVELLKLIGLIK